MNTDKLRELLAKAIGSEWLKQLRIDAERYRIFCEQVESDQFPVALLNDALEMGAGVLDMYFDDAIAAQDGSDHV